jgi:hypothetical protein
MAGAGEAPVFAQAPAPVANGEEEAPNNTIEFDSDDTAFEVIPLPTSSPFAVVPPPVPMATTIETFSAESRVGPDRERSTAEEQIPPSATGSMLETVPSLAVEQPTLGAEPATEIAEVAQDSAGDEVGDGDEGIIGLPAEPLLQTGSSNAAHDYTLAGVLLIVAGCAMFVWLVVFVWLQSRRA